MKKSTKWVLVLTMVLVVGSISGKSMATVAGYSDKGCPPGEWWILDNEGNYNALNSNGCTEYESKGKPWCATKWVKKSGIDTYISGGGEGTKWDYCDPISVLAGDACAVTAQCPAKTACGMPNYNAPGKGCLGVEGFSCKSDNFCVKGFKCIDGKCVPPKVALTPDPAEPATPDSNYGDEIITNEPLSSCGGYVWQDGKTYVLGKDILFDAKGEKGVPDQCFFLSGAQNIVLDCRRHVIRSSIKGMGTAIGLANTNNVTIKGCTFKDFEKGITVTSESQDTIIASNSFIGNEFGILFIPVGGISSQGNYISGNVFDANSEGVVFVGTANSTIKENNFHATGGTSIKLIGGPNFAISNTITGGNTGILVYYGTTKAVLRKNVIRYAKTGIDVELNEPKAISELDSNIIEKCNRGIAYDLGIGIGNTVLTNNQVCSSIWDDVYCGDKGLAVPPKGVEAIGNKFQFLSGSCLAPVSVFTEGANYTKCSP